MLFEEGNGNFVTAIHCSPYEIYWDEWQIQVEVILDATNIRKRFTEY